MKHKLLTLIALAFFSIATSAQHNWYDIGTQTYLTAVATGSAPGGTVTLGGVTNPNTSGINTTATTNKFEKAASTTSYIKVSLPNPILAANVTSTIVKVKLYFEEFDDLPNTTLRMYLRDTGNGNTNRQYVTLNFAEADEGVWKEYTFDFSGSAEPYNAEYDEIQLFFNLANSTDTATYYFDGISGNVSMEDPELGQLISGNSWYYNQATSDFIGTPIATLATFSSSETNPDTSELNTNATVAKLTKSEGAHSGLTFDISSTPITDFSSTKFKLQAYLDVTTATVQSTNNCNIRIGLRNNSAGPATQSVVSQTINIGEKWGEYTFDFNGISQLETTYDVLFIYFVSPDTSLEATGFEFYIDALQGPDLATLSSEDIVLDNSKLQITPNPVSTTFQLTNNESVETIQLYGISGALLKTFKGSDKYDISDLSSGVYFAKITTPFNSTKLVKIIKE